MPSGLSEHHRIVSTLRYLGPMSRHALSQVTGLPMGTVVSGTVRLADQGVLDRVSLDRSGGGRPQQRWGLRPSYGHTIGVSLSLDAVSVVLVDYAGKVVGTKSMPLRGPADPVTCARLAAEGSQRLIHDGGGPLRVFGAGVSIPGVYELGRGVVFLPNLAGWTGSDPASVFRDLLGLPVRLENDANAAAYAEWRQGAAQGTHSFVYLLVHDGTGGAIVVDGHTVRGVAGAAGEIGHLPVGGMHRCNCGLTGCLETEASGMALRRLVEEEGLSAPQAIHHLAEKLGPTIASLANTLAPEGVVMGGWVVETYPELTFETADRAREHMVPLLAGMVRFTPAALGTDASAIGAALIMLDSSDEENEGAGFLVPTPGGVVMGRR